MKIASLTPDWGDLLGGDISVLIDLLGGRGTWKQIVRVATTGDTTIATLIPGAVVNGVTVAGGDRVLVWQNTAAEENGIYIVDVDPERAGDFDESGEIVGTFVPVLEGALYAGQIFRNTNTGDVDIDTDDITFELWLPVGATATDAMVPYYIPAGTEFTVPIYKQALFSDTIEVDGILTVLGRLNGVD